VVPAPAEPALAGATVAAGSAGSAAAPLDGPATSADASRRSGLAGVLLSPGTTVSCRIAMGVTMALMLFLMI
jgi:hypothetical protein